MTKLTIVAFDGTSHELDVSNGSTVMENAVRNSVPALMLNVAAPVPVPPVMSMWMINGRSG